MSLQLCITAAMAIATVVLLDAVVNPEPNPRKRQATLDKIAVWRGERLPEADRDHSRWQAKWFGIYNSASDQDPQFHFEPFFVVTCQYGRLNVVLGIPGTTDYTQETIQLKLLPSGATRRMRLPSRTDRYHIHLFLRGENADEFVRLIYSENTLEVTFTDGSGPVSPYSVQGAPEALFPVLRNCGQLDKFNSAFTQPKPAPLAPSAEQKIEPQPAPKQRQRSRRQVGVAEPREEPPAEVEPSPPKQEELVSILPPTSDGLIASPLGKPEHSEKIASPRPTTQQDRTVEKPPPLKAPPPVRRPLGFGAQATLPAGEEEKRGPPPSTSWSWQVREFGYYNALGSLPPAQQKHPYLIVTCNAGALQLTLGIPEFSPKDITIYMANVFDFGISFAPRDDFWWTLLESAPFAGHLQFHFTESKAETVIDKMINSETITFRIVESSRPTFGTKQPVQFSVDDASQNLSTLRQRC